MSRSTTFAVLGALALAALVPAIGWGHPVTDLAVNHFTRVNVAAERIKVRYVVTMSEIVTFVELRAAGVRNIDSPTVDELNAYARRAASTFSAGLVLRRNGSRVDLVPVSRSVSMPTGERGFKRLRLEFEFEGDSGLADGSISRFRFEDTNHPGRSGWREIVVMPETGLTVFGSSAFGSPAADELKAFPADLLRRLDERAAEFSAVSGRAPVGVALLRTRDGRTIGTRDGFAPPDAGQAAAVATTVMILLIPIYRRYTLRRGMTIAPTIWRVSPVCAAVGLAACAMYAAPWQAGSADTSRLRISLVEAKTGRPVAGLIRVIGANGQALRLEGVLPRGQGLGDVSPINEWYVLARERTIQLPQQKLRIEAFAGLKSALATLELDLAGRADASVNVPVSLFGDVAQKGWYGGNTHLHLRNITAEQATQYLTEVSAADDLDVLFISYLERPSEDRTYTTNRYPIGDFAKAWRTEALLNNGEEHRHNFEGYGEGFGHVLLLNINKLIVPVSIGPGITGGGSDGAPLRPGIDEAHRQGGTAIWAHNGWGFEDVPNFATARPDALNIFDGGSHGTYEDSFYHFLNAGLRVPFSTGTDWFIDDLNRVYANVRGNLTIRSWLDALKAGQSFITNGPLLEFSAGNTEIGGTLALDSPGEVQVRGRAAGRQNFGKLQLVRNGRVIDETAAVPSGAHFEARLDRRIAIDGPCWLALRVSSTSRSEYGRELFGHTSPVYVTVGGANVRIQQDVDWLIRDMEQAIETIAARGSFATPSERERVLSVYREGIAALRGNGVPARGLR
jgi:hypothetical protein